MVAMTRVASRLLELVGVGEGARRRFAVTAIGTFLLKVFARATGFIVTFVLARLLGAEGLGTYFYALSLTKLISVIGVPSLRGLVIQRVAAYRSSEDWSLTRGFLRCMRQAGLIVAMTFAACAALIAWIFVGDSASDMQITFFVAILMLPFLALLHLGVATLEGLNHVTLSQVPLLAVRPILFMAILLGLFFALGAERTPAVAMAAQLLGTLLAMLLALYLVRQRIPHEIRSAAPAYETKQWSRGAVPFLITGALIVVNQQAGILLLGALKDPVAVGIYRPASTMAMLIMFGAEAVTMAIRPAIARRFVTGRVDAIQRLATYGARAGFSIALLGAAVAIAFSDWILGIFGPEFVAGTTPLAILCMGRVAFAMLGMPASFLDMTGHQSSTARGLAIAVTINVVLCLALIPLFGVNGAAIANTVGLLLRNVLLMLQARRRLGVDSTILGPAWTGLSSSTR